MIANPQPTLAEILAPLEARRTTATANRFAVACQLSRLGDAILSGPTALEDYARREQEKRDRRADAEWQNYRLLSAGNGLVKTATGERYERVLTLFPRNEELYRFPDVPDQVFVDAVNAALRAAGLAFRMMTKHNAVFYRLREEENIPWSLGGSHAPVYPVSAADHIPWPGFPDPR